MTTRTRPGRPLLALTLALAGCFGTSDDKGDNGGSVITPKPSKVEDANTAGNRNAVLPPPGKPDVKADKPADAEKPDVKADKPADAEPK